MLIASKYRLFSNFVIFEGKGLLVFQYFPARGVCCMSLINLFLHLDFIYILYDILLLYVLYK